MTSNWKQLDTRAAGLDVFGKPLQTEIQRQKQRPMRHKQLDPRAALKSE
jgi:hypothetical protein